MAKPTAQPEDVAAVERYLHEAGLDYLRARSRADLVVIESGPAGDPLPHARLRRAGVSTWRLEMATHTGRWEKTPIDGALEDVLQTLVQDFGWTLTPIE
jgi:hypothetical protein